MKQQEEQKYVNLIDHFEDYVSLWNIISKDVSLIKLQNISNKIHNDKYGNSYCRYPSILLTGSVGKRTHAVAILRSLGIENYKTIEGQLYGPPSYSMQHFTNDNEGVVLCNIEYLDVQCQKIILDIIRTGQFGLYNYISKGDEKFIYKGILILTCSDLSKIHEQIFKSVNHFVQILPYDQTELGLMVLQRLKFSGIDIAEDSLIEKIVKQGGDIVNIVRFLRDCVMVMKSDSRNNILEKEDVEMAVKLG